MSGLKMAALDHLNEMIGNDRAIMRELIEEYLSHTAETIEGIKTNLEAREDEVVTRLAHSLKSTSGQLGAVTLQGMFLKLEKMDKNEAFTNMDTVLGELTSEFDIVRKALINYLDH